MIGESWNVDEELNNFAPLAATNICFFRFGFAKACGVGDGFKNTFVSVFLVLYIYIHIFIYSFICMFILMFF